MAVQDLHAVAPSTTSTTRDVLKPIAWANEMQSLPRYVFAQRLMNGWGEEGGAGAKHYWGWNDTAGDPKPPVPLSYTYSPRYEADAALLSAPWYEGHDDCAIPQSIIDRNQGDAQLHNEKDQQYEKALTRMFEGQEANALTPRAVTQTEYPVSIPMIVPIAGNVGTAGSRVNAFAAGHSSIFGMDTSDSGHPKYRPWTFNYSGFGPDDFPIAASRCMREIDFTPIPGTSMLPNSTTPGNVMVLTEPSTMGQMEMAATLNNDNNGRSLTPSYANTSFFGVTPTISHKLAELIGAQGTTNSWPIYFLNLSKDGIWPVFLANNNRFVRDVYWEKAPLSNVWYCAWHWSYAIRCLSRRRLGGACRTSNPPFGESNV